MVMVFKRSICPCVISMDVAELFHRSPDSESDVATKVSSSLTLSSLGSNVGRTPSSSVSSSARTFSDERVGSTLRRPGADEDGIGDCASMLSASSSGDSSESLVVADI